MARLIRDLTVAASSSWGTVFHELPEYRRLFEHAHAYGFTTLDLAPLGKHFQPYVDAPDRLRAAGLPHPAPLPPRDDPERARR